MKLVRRTWPLALLGWLVLPGRAEAGIVKDSIDFVQVIPFVGAEYVHLGSAINPTGVPSIQDYSTTGLTFGGVVGVRLAPVSFGLLLQRTKTDNPIGGELAMNKLYGQFGINAQYGRFLLLTHFDFGYAFLGVANTT